MKRDKDLLKSILEHLEEHHEIFRNVEIGASTFTAPLETVKYHLRLLEQAGFIRVDSESLEGVSVREITWNGHEYLDELRKD